MSLTNRVAIVFVCCIPCCFALADENQPFDQLSGEYLSGHFAFRPGDAVGLGLHEYDGRPADLSKASLDRELARLKDFEGKLAALDETKLNGREKFDHRILLNAVRSEIFNFENVRRYQSNPMTYVLGQDVNVYIERDFAPLEERLKSVIAVEEAAPKLLAAAKENLDESLPKPFVETAIRSAKGASDFLEHDLPAAFAQVKDKALMQRFAQANGKAAGIMRDYVSYLQSQKLPKAKPDFALGRENYIKMLQMQEMITLPPEQVLEIGMKQLKREHEIFAKVAAMIDPNKKPLDVFSEIQKDHPTADGLIPDTRRDLDSIRQFIIDHKLVSIPSQERAKVMETPGFDRAGSFASMSSPGAFETKAREAIYYVTPVEADWSAQQKEQWLTSFNYYELDVVSIHEAYPGHYVQFLHLNNSPATKIEKIFGSYAFIEGWAHYTEQMVLDEGFGGEGARAAKFRMAQSSEALLRLCRLCCSIRMHCQGMTVDEAANFFHDNCYYQSEPAHEEAMRGTFDPGYLFYTVGKMQLLKLREDYRKQEGDNFSLLKFHDAVLGHGMPPVRLLREMLLKDPAIYDQDL